MVYVSVVPALARGWWNIANFPDTAAPEFGAVQDAGLVAGSVCPTACADRRLAGPSACVPVRTACSHGAGQWAVARRCWIADPSNSCQGPPLLGIRDWQQQIVPTTTLSVFLKSRQETQISSFVFRCTTHFLPYCGHVMTSPIASNGGNWSILKKNHASSKLPVTFCISRPKVGNSNQAVATP